MFCRACGSPIGQGRPVAPLTAGIDLPAPNAVPVMAVAPRGTVPWAALCWLLSPFAALLFLWLAPKDTMISTLAFLSLFGAPLFWFLVVAWLLWRFSR